MLKLRQKRGPSLTPASLCCSPSRPPEEEEEQKATRNNWKLPFKSLARAGPRVGVDMYAHAGNLLYPLQHPPGQVMAFSMDKEQTGSFQVTQWEPELDHKPGGPAPQPLCHLEFRIVVIHRGGNARGAWRKLTSDRGTPLLKSLPGLPVALWKSQKTYFGLWDWPWPSYKLTRHHSPVLLAAVHLYLYPFHPISMTSPFPPQDPCTLCSNCLGHPPSHLMHPPSHS